MSRWTRSVPRSPHSRFKLAEVDNVNCKFDPGIHSTRADRLPCPGFRFRECIGELYSNPQDT